jgi:hypothetical protein
VARIPVEACAGHPLANDQGYGFAGEATNRDPPVATDGPEDWTILDPRGAELGFQHPDGAVNGSAEWDADPPADAVLISLRPADHNDDAMSGALVSMQLIADRLQIAGLPNRPGGGPCVVRSRISWIEVERSFQIAAPDVAAWEELGGAWEGLVLTLRIGLILAARGLRSPIELSMEMALKVFLNLSEERTDAGVKEARTGGSRFAILKESA